MSALLVLIASASSPSGTQQALKSIAVSCGLKAGNLQLREDRLVHVQPKRKPSYESVMCVFPKLREAGFTYPIGIISEPPQDAIH